MLVFLEASVRKIYLKGRRDGRPEWPSISDSASSSRYLHMRIYEEGFCWIPPRRSRTTPGFDSSISFVVFFEPSLSLLCSRYLISRD